MKFIASMLFATLMISAIASPVHPLQESESESGSTSSGSTVDRTYHCEIGRADGCKRQACINVGGRCRASSEIGEAKCDSSGLLYKNECKGCDCIGSWGPAS